MILFVVPFRILSAFIRTLNNAANAIVSAHKSRHLDNSASRSQSTRLASVFAYTAVPHLLTCLLEHIFGGDAASHLWQLHQENDATPTTSQLISRFTKEVCAPIFEQWAQLTNGPLREAQIFPSNAENARSDKTLQAEDLKNVVDKPLDSSGEPESSNNAQHETVTPLISETATNEVIKTLEEPILNSASIKEEVSLENNASISNQPSIIIPSSVVQSPIDQQTVPMVEGLQLPQITNAEDIEVAFLKESVPSSEPNEVLPNKVAISEVPFKSDEGESLPNATYASAVRSPLASECQLLSGSTPSPLKRDLLKTRHQESQEPLSTAKSELDEDVVASKQKLIENSNTFGNDDLKSEMKGGFVESEPKIETFSTERTPSEPTFQFSEIDHIKENLVDENSSSSVLDRVGLTADSEEVEQFTATNSGMKQDSTEIPLERIDAEDRRGKQIAQDFTTGWSSVVTSSNLKLEEPDEPSRKRDDLHCTEQSYSQAVNPEVSDLPITTGHGESASMFMDQPENVVSDSFNAENNSEVNNAEYTESIVKVENVKIEESFPNQVGGIYDLPAVQNQISEEVACNTATEETELGSEEILSESELKASLDSPEVPSYAKIEDREKDGMEKIDTDILNSVAGHSGIKGDICSLNTIGNNIEPFLRDVGAESIDLSPSYAHLSSECKEPCGRTCIPGLSNAKLENSEDVHEVVGSETPTQRISTMIELEESINIDKDGSVWKEKDELYSDSLTEEGASRTNDNLTRIEHPEGNNFKTEISEEVSTQSIANPTTQEQTSDVNSPKCVADQSVEPDESWQDGDDLLKGTEIELANPNECKTDVEPAVQSNLSSLFGSQEIEVKPEPREPSSQNILSEEDRSSSLPEVDHQEVGTVKDACGSREDKGVDLEVEGIEESETPPALQSAEAITTTLSGEVNDIKRSLNCAAKSEAFDLSSLTTFVSEPSEDTKISMETKVGVKQYAASDDNCVQSNLDILVETQVTEMEAGPLMQLPEEKQKSNFLDGEYQDVECAWVDDVNEWDEVGRIDINEIEAKKSLTSAETVIPSKESSNIGEFLDYQVNSEGTGPSDFTPSNKELLEDIPVLPNEFITTVLSKEQDEKTKSLDYHAKFEFFEPTSIPSVNEISEEEEGEAKAAENLDGWGGDADLDIGELENKGNFDLTEVTESVIAPHNFGKADVAIASSEKFADLVSMKSDHNSLGERHSKESENPGPLPCGSPKAADALDENSNALSEGGNLDEIKSSSGLIGRHPSDENFSNVEIAGEESENANFGSCECWEDDNWLEERDPTETLPQVSKSVFPDPITQNTQAGLGIELEVSDKEGEQTYWDDDDATWGEGPDQIKVFPINSETNAQTPDEKNTLEAAPELESTGWEGDENNWGDDIELQRDDMEINKSIADQTSPSTTSLFVPASNEGDSGTIPKDRSKGAKID
ncbi:unnamed protein product [Rodentolepis nana]|uniref:Serine/threonine-protein phosphatase 4 regulatory subunit 2 n=1 Tax=Rodentolepis nana TaxID=102285 RepID=A0A0R3T796_RODNA|nr:unnamed protein product [Rodentolepis nana]